jgi:hypothetical protein
VQQEKIPLMTTLGRFQFVREAEQVDLTWRQGWPWLTGSESEATREAVRQRARAALVEHLQALA